MKTLKYISTFILVLTSMFLFAQDNNEYFRNFNVRQGLPSARVIHMHQDQEGFIWATTNNGISKFDGYSFQNFSNTIGDSTSLSGDYIFTVTSDSNFLWVGHYEGGLDLFDITKGEVIRHWDENDTVNAIPDNKITKLWVEKEKNRVWVGTSKEHFAWIDLTTGAVTLPKLNNHELNKYPSPERNSIYDIVPHSSLTDSYWLGTNEGLGLYNETTGTLRYFYPKEPKVGYSNFNRLRDIEMIEDELWIATRGDGGLLSFDTNDLKWTKYKLSDNVHNLSTQLIRKSDDQLWIGTLNENNAFLSFDLNTKAIREIRSNTSLPYKLQSNVIFDLLKDKAGNIWLGTEKGLSFYTNAHQLFPAKPFQSKEIAKSTPLTFQAFQKKVYAGLSFSYGILEIDPTTGNQRMIKTQKAFERFGFIRMTVSPKGELWATGQLRLFKLSKNKNTLLEQKVPVSKDKKIRFQSLYFHNENTLLLGTRFNGLLVWNQQTNSSRFINTQNSNFVHNRFINEIIPDNNGHIWVSTERGISILDAKSLKVIRNYGLEEGFKMTYRLTFDQNGTMWASSENKGVYGFNTITLEQSQHITKVDGLPSNAIQHLAADMSGNLWISTQQGLCKYSLKDKSILIFSSENGLIENHLEGSLNAISKEYMALGFKGSATIFNTTTTQTFKTKKPPTITEVNILNRKFYGTPNLDHALSYKENDLSFAYSALNFAIPENLSYQYRLTGQNDQWSSPTSSLNTSYTNLNSGDYTFQVRYSVKGFEGWSIPASFSFTIEPPFWQTNWFYGLCFIALATSLWFIYESKIRQIKNKEKIKTAMNKELSALEMKALRSQMNPHFIFNSLNSIKYYVLQNETNKASKYLNDFSKLIRRIFNNTQSEFSLLEEEIETLKLFLEIEKLRFGDKMNYQFDIDPDLELPFIKVPNMLIQPFIENSVWHGIMHTVKGGTIVVRFQMLENNYLQIQVEDNGIGRKASLEKRSKTVDHKSKGIKLTQKRIELINENLQMDITLNIKDLHDQDKARGTLVTLKMRILDA